MVLSRSWRAIVAFVMVAASLVTACRESPTAPSDVPLGEPFELRIGESAVLPGDLKVTFNRVDLESIQNHYREQFAG